MTGGPEHPASSDTATHNCVRITQTRHSSKLFLALIRLQEYSAWGFLGTAGTGPDLRYDLPSEPGSSLTDCLLPPS